MSFRNHPFQAGYLAAQSDHIHVLEKYYFSVPSDSEGDLSGGGGAQILVILELSATSVID
jgi:hypothetical protein